MDTENLNLGEQSPTIEFPNGLIGCEEWRFFTLITHPAGGPLRLLQSLEDDRLSFIVVDPRDVVENYRVPQAADDQAGIYCILSIQEEPFQVTANLLGPLVIDWENGQGQQHILTDTSYSPRHLITQAEVAH